MVPEGEVVGTTERQERGRYTVGIRLAGNGSKNDVPKGLRNIECLNVLSHGNGLTLLLCFQRVFMLQYVGGLGKGPILPAYPRHE